MTRKSSSFIVFVVTAAWFCGAVELAGQSGGSLPPVANRSAALTAGGYDAGGRRDPFVSLISPKAAPVAAKAAVTARPGAGLGGITVSDVQLKGVIRSGANFLAILQGPDGRTFMARRADRLMDGVIKGIESNAVVFTERVEDAAGAVRSHDVRKALRPVVAGGQS